MVVDWELTPLGHAIDHRKQFITIDDTQNYKRCRVQMHAQGVVLRDIVSGVEIKTKQQQVCRAGEFLVAEIDAKVGGFGIVPDELDGSLVSSHYFLFIINESVLDKQFLSYFIRTPAFQDQVSAQGSTNYAAIRPQHVLGYEIPLPPIDEQRHIVAEIEALAARIAEARGLRQGAVEEAEATFGVAVATIFQDLDRQFMGPQLGNFVLDVRYGTSRKTSEDTSGTPVFRMGNIQRGSLIFANFRYLILDESERRSLLLEPGDILVNRTNSAELVGKCSVFDQDGEYSFASYIIRVRLDQTRALPTLVAYYINSPIGRKYMFRERKQMTGQANINSVILNSLPLPLPSIDEQQQISDYLDHLHGILERLSYLQAQTNDELDALLPSILDRAFRGEL